MHDVTLFKYFDIDSFHLHGFNMLQNSVLRKTKYIFYKSGVGSEGSFRGCKRTSQNLDF